MEVEEKRIDRARGGDKKEMKKLVTGKRKINRAKKKKKIEKLKGEEKEDKQNEGKNKLFRYCRSLCAKGLSRSDWGL